MLLCRAGERRHPLGRGDQRLAELPLGVVLLQLRLRRQVGFATVTGGAVGQEDLAAAAGRRRDVLIGHSPFERDLE